MALQIKKVIVYPIYCKIINYDLCVLLSYNMTL